VGLYPELDRFDLRDSGQQLPTDADRDSESVKVMPPRHAPHGRAEGPLQQLIAHFSAPAPDGEAFAFAYYSEVALRIRQHGPQGVDFLYREHAQASDERVRAILFALAEPPKLRRPWLPELWLAYLDDRRGEIVAEAIDCLWRYGDRKSKYRVLQYQRHDSAYVRGSVLRYVSRMVPHCAPLLLILALRDEHFLVRETAIDELDRLEVGDALPYLYRLLEDRAPQVRQAARTAIEHLESPELMEGRLGAARKAG
jgi:hypothetical protein